MNSTRTCNMLRMTKRETLFVKEASIRDAVVIWHAIVASKRYRRYKLYIMDGTLCDGEMRRR